MTATATAVQLLLNNFGGRETAYARAGRVGSPGIPMLAQLAQPVSDGAHYYGVECTTTGPVCGVCTDGLRSHPGHLDYSDGHVRHASAAHVRRCTEVLARMEDDAAAEAPLIAAGWL
jgi:hypothetical protein